MKILVLHGPNLNLLGKREPGIYGEDSYHSINEMILKYAESKGVECEVYQSNHEGELIDKLHSVWDEGVEGVVLNAGAFTHYSYALRDAIAAVSLPCVEVHLSNVFKREEFRHHSVISPVCAGVISGFGKQSYLLGIDALLGVLGVRA